MSIAALIARLEAATEASVELDFAIASLLGADRIEVTTAEEFRQKHGRLPYVGMEWLPHYTASLDAALTLVPEEWSYVKLERYSDGWYCELRKHSGYDLNCRGDQKPAPIALCIAALKARASR